MTQRNVVAKIAEFFDPIGMWESVKLQLKLKLTKVSKLQWDECLRAPKQDQWKDMLARFTEYNKFRGVLYPGSRSLRVRSASSVLLTPLKKLVEQQCKQDVS